MKTETVSLNGEDFFVRSWGEPSRPTILMLHGFPEYGGAWADLAAHLSDRFHCVAPDQRGYGQSWSPEGVEMYAAQKLTADMAALIEYLGGPVIVFGHDWGAAVAYGLAMFRPDLVSRLIIANGVHPVPFQRAIAAGGAQTEASQYIHLLRKEGSEDRLAADDFAQMSRMFRSQFGKDWLTDARLVEYKTEWARGGGRLGTMINWYRASPLRVAEPGKPITDLPEMPREKLMVRCPHLLIWGEKDSALLPEATEGLEEFAPELTRETLPDADHWILHQEPERVAAIVSHWLEQRADA